MTQTVMETAFSVVSFPVTAFVEMIAYLRHAVKLARMKATGRAIESEIDAATDTLLESFDSYLQGLQAARERYLTTRWPDRLSAQRGLHVLKAVEAAMTDGYLGHLQSRRRSLE